MKVLRGVRVTPRPPLNRKMTPSLFRVTLVNKEVFFKKNVAKNVIINKLFSFRSIYDSWSVSSSEKGWKLQGSLTKYFVCAKHCLGETNAENYRF